MTRRWAPVAAAAAVVVLVLTIALLAGRGPDRPSAVAPAAPAAPAPPSPASPSSPAEASDGPDTAVSSGAEPTPAPSAKPQPSAAASTAPTAAVRSPAPPPPPPSASAAPPPPPPPPPPSPGPGRAALPFDAAYGTDDPNEVIVQYGDSSSCPHENVTKAVRESTDTVVVALTADAQQPERACTADYRQMLVPVALARPLGTRRVLDAATGKEVEVDRSCSRPFQNPPPPRDCTQ